MWIVAKIKTQEINIFKEKLVEKFGKEVKFYSPKITYSKHFNNRIKKFDKLILENYIFCHHRKFDELNTIREIQFIDGLQYVLGGYIQSQREIKKFIEHCKSFEDKDGYIVAAFFKTIIKNKAQFMSGPFTNVMFEIIERQKNKLKILIGGIVTTISDKKNYLYRPI